MLRAQIFQRLIAVALGRNLSNQEFVFCRQRHAELFAIARHIKDCLADHRRLAHHANIRGPRGKQERLNLVILLNQSGIF